jgi:hypothetical protein
MGLEVGGAVNNTEPTTSVTTTTTRHEAHPRAIVFVPALLVGWGMIAYGAMHALDDAGDAHPLAIVVHIVAFDVLHDVVIAPIVLLTAWMISKVVPHYARGTVRFAAAASAIVTVFSWPLVRAWGKRPNNSSTLPLDYGRNLVIVLAAIWALSIVTIVRRARAHSTVSSAARDAKD